MYVFVMFCAVSQGYRTQMSICKRRTETGHVMHVTTHTVVFFPVLNKVTSERVESLNP